jgi:RNA polymerase sigma factor (sigma-70 family)
VSGGVSHDLVRITSRGTVVYWEMWVTTSALERYVSHGDAEAFRALVVHYQDLVYGTCSRVLGGSPDVDDAVQETFIKLAKKAPEIRTNPGAWLHACARTTALNVLKTRRSRRRREQRLDYHASPTARADLFESADEASVIDACLEELPATDREVIISYFFVEHSQEEIAKRVGVTQGSIQRRLDRVLEDLRRKFIRRGLAVSGLMSAYFGELAAASTVPPELAHNLAGVCDGAVRSAALRSQAAASGVYAKGASLSFKAIKGLVALIVIGAAIFTVSRLAQPPSAPFHAAWDFSKQAPEPKLFAGQWQWQAPENGVRGGVYAKSIGIFDGWILYKLPVLAPNKPLLATIHVHPHPDHPDGCAFKFGWLLDRGERVPYHRWHASRELRSLAADETRAYQMYLLGDFVILSDDGKLVDMFQYEPGHQSEHLYFHFLSLVFEGLELRELDAEEIPRPFREPLLLIDEQKLRRVDTP